MDTTNFKSKNIYYFSKRVLKFKSPNQLVKEEDLFNLFMGVYRLMKRNIEITMEDKYLDRIRYLESKINKLNNKI